MIRRTRFAVGEPVTKSIQLPSNNVNADDQSVNQPDPGCAPQSRDPRETLSAFTVIRERFFRDGTVYIGEGPNGPWREVGTIDSIFSGKV